MKRTLHPILRWCAMRAGRRSVAVLVPVAGAGSAARVGVPRMAMIRRRASGAVMLSLVSLALVAGCGGSGASADESELDRYMAIAWGSQEQREERDLVLAEQFENAIVQCMNGQGFEYYPTGGYVSFDESPSMDSIEFREVYGYGITTSPPMSDALERDDTRNEEYRSALSRDTRSAYYIALEGRDPEVAYEEPPTPAGCYQEAWDSVYGAEIQLNQQWSKLWDDIAELGEEISSSPGVAALNSDWSNCLADRQFSGITDPNGARGHIGDLFSAIQVPNAQGLVETDQEALAALQEREIRLAVADLECQAKVNYTSRYNAVRIEYENAFVRTHKADLEAWSAAASRR